MSKINKNVVDSQNIAEWALMYFKYIMMLNTKLSNNFKISVDNTFNE